jgi:hypothetical protein
VCKFRWVITSELCNSPAYSQLRFVTPEQRHSGDDAVLLEQRKCVLERVK